MCSSPAAHPADVLSRAYLLPDEALHAAREVEGEPDRFEWVAAWILLVLDGHTSKLEGRVAHVVVPHVALADVLLSVIGIATSAERVVL